MDFMTVVNQMLALFLIMVIGYGMYKARVIDKTATERFTKLVLNISLPAQILNSFLKNRGVVSNGEVISVLLVSAFCFAVYAVLGAAFVTLIRPLQKDRGVYLFMCSFGNVGFMGFPVITTIFGDDALIYAVIYNVVFNICMYSYGVFWMNSAGTGFRFDPKLLLNVPFVASLLSIFLFFTGIPLPQVVMDSLDYLGNVTTPVAMLILGATIATMPLKELFDDWRIYVFTAFRLAALPAAMFLVFYLLPVSTPLIQNVMIAISAMPVATNATMLAIQYDGNLNLTSRGIFFTTVLSVISIPLVAMLCF